MNRVDKLAADYMKLSMVERGEFLSAIGTPPFRIKKILEDEFDNFFERMNQGEINPYNEDNETEFLLYHVRPEWIDSTEPIPQGQYYYVLEFIYDDVITIRIRYDRAKFIERITNTAMVARFLEWYKQTEQRLENPCQTVNQMYPLRAPDYDYLRVINTVCWYPGSEQEYFESIEEMSERIRNYYQKEEWWLADCELLQEQARKAEVSFCSSVMYKLHNAINRLTSEIGIFLTREDGVVSANEYAQIAHDPVFFVRKAERGGDQRSKYKLEDEETSKLGKHYEEYKPVLSGAKASTQTTAPGKLGVI